MKRLSQLSDISGPATLPAYVPEAHGRGIVHLGIGAFHRAHQAAMTDAALASAGGDWRITGVSLRSREPSEALTPQNGLYTLIENSPDGPKARVIGAIRDVISADPTATLAALADPSVHIVTLTVTEKGYGIDRFTHSPDWNNPAVAADKDAPRTPKGVLGLLTEALRLRRKAGIAPFTVLSCDNLPENGQLLKAGVVGFARVEDAAFADWIDQNVAFPSSMVDRITPAATHETQAEAERQTGCEDRAAIAAEPFIQWVIEDNFPQGRPNWEAGGAQFVQDVVPYERMKLTMLNGTHSMMAYAGVLTGKRYVRDVMADAALLQLVRRHLKAAAKTVPATDGMGLDGYAEALEARFRNPAIAHQAEQIAMDGTQKMPQRIFAPALIAHQIDASLRPFAFATALWMRFTLGRTEQGISYPLNDPRAAEIQTALEATEPSAEAIIQALNSLPALIPAELAQLPEWHKEVKAALQMILEDGASTAVRKEAALQDG